MEPIDPDTFMLKYLFMPDDVIRISTKKYVEMQDEILDSRKLIEKYIEHQKDIEAEELKLKNFDKAVKDREESDQKLFKLKEEYQLLNEKLNETTKQFHQYKTTYKEKIVNAPIHKEKIEELIDKIRHLKTENASLQTESSNKEKKIKDIQEKLEYTERNYKYLQSTIKKDNNKSRAYEQNLEHNMRVTNKYQQETEKIKSTIKKLEAEIRQSKMENKDNLHEQRIKDIKYRKIDNDYDAQVNRVKELREQLDKSLHEKCHLDKENQTLKSEVGKKIEEIRTQTQKFNNLSNLLEMKTEECNIAIDVLKEKRIILTNKLVRVKDELSKIKKDLVNCLADKDALAQTKRKIVFATKEIELMHKEIADLKQEKLDITRECRTAEGVPLQMVGTKIIKLHKIRSFDKESTYCDCGVTKNDDQYFGVKQKRNYESRIAKLGEDNKHKDRIIKKQTSDIDNLSDTIDRMRKEIETIKKDNKKLQLKSEHEDKRILYITAKTAVQKYKALQFQRIVAKRDIAMHQYRNECIRYNRDTMDAINRADLAEKRLMRFRRANQITKKVKNALNVSRIEVQTKSLNNRQLLTKNNELEKKLNSMTKELINAEEKLKRKNVQFADKLNSEVITIKELNAEIKKLRKEHEYNKNIASKMLHDALIEIKKLTIHNKSLTLIRDMYIENKKINRVLTKSNLNKSIKIEKFKALSAHLRRKLVQRVYRYRIPKYIHFSTGNHGTSRMIEIPEEIEEPKLPRKPKIKNYQKPKIIYVTPYGVR